MTWAKRRGVLASLGAGTLILLSVQVALPRRHKRRGAATPAAAEGQAPANTSVEEGVVRDGHRVVQVSGPFGDSCLVTLSRLASTGELAFVFAVGRDYSEHGALFITASRLAYQPDQPKYSARAFSASRSEVAGFNPTPTFLHLRPHGLLEMQVQGHKYSFDYCTVSWMGDPKGTPKEVRRQHDRLADEANYVFAGWLNLAMSNFGEAVQRFRTQTANAAIPLSDVQQATVTSHENAGDAAAQAGKLYDALQDYETALQALPAQWAPRDVEKRLEEKAIKLVLRMNPRPAIPQDAMRHMAYAQTAFQEAKGPTDLDNAVKELNKALRLAPWWGDAYKNLGLLDEKANRYADVARNLQLYLLATPNAPDAQSVQMKIYSLQYKAKQQAGAN